MTAISEGREEITAALATVSGVTATQTRPSVITPGSAWPEWQGANRQGLFVQQWRILICVGKTELDAEAFTDNRAGEIIDALTPACYVNEVLPVRLAVEDLGALYSVQFTAIRE